MTRLVSPSRDYTRSDVGERTGPRYSLSDRMGQIKWDATDNAFIVHGALMERSAIRELLPALNDFSVISTCDFAEIERENLDVR